MGYSIRKIKKMMGRKRVNGKRWYQIFPREDTYIYKAGDGSNTVVNVLRKVNRRHVMKQEPEFWTEISKFVGAKGMPDFYTKKEYTGIEDIHNKDQQVLMLTKPKSKTSVVRCQVPSSTTPTTTHYTTTPTTTHYTTTPPTTHYTTTTPTTHSDYFTTTPTTTHYTTTSHSDYFTTTPTN